MTTATTTTTTTISVTDEDSGFDSQTKIEASTRPISSAVNEWLKTAKSPNLFVMPMTTSEEDLNDDEEEEEEEEEEEDASVKNEPPKNLQSNPIPALSVNGCADERGTIRGKIARANSRSGDKDEDAAKALNNASSKRNRRTKRAKKKRAKSFKLNVEAHNSSKDNLQDTNGKWTSLPLPLTS
jgi:hypothetical protein